MKKMLPAIITLLILALLEGGCSKPRTNKTDIEDQLEKQCREKYGLDVITKKRASHLGVCGTCENIFEVKDRKEIISRITLAASHALTKQKSDISFFHLILRDKTSGVQNRYVWNRKDLEKNALSLISPAKFRNRALFTATNNLDFLGKKRIEQFFEMLPSHTLKDLLKVNPRITLKIFSKDFFHHLMEISMKEDVKYDVLYVKTKAVSKNRTLFACKIRHSFSPKDSFQKSSFKYSSGSIIHFLFGIENVNYLDIRISEIYTFESFEKGEFSEEIRALGDPEYWREQDFYLPDTTLPHFIAGMIAQRIEIHLRQEEDLIKKPLQIDHVQGTFLDKRFQIVFQTKDSADSIDYDTINDLVVQVIREVCEIYNFTDFEKVELMFPAQGVFKTFEKKELGI